jgi:FMN phosphatase YigB (HAD superfamily)
MHYKVFFVDFGGVLVLNRVKEIGAYFDRTYGLTKDDSTNTFRFLHSGEKSDAEVDRYLEEHHIKKDVWQKYKAELFNSETRNEDLINILEDAKKSGIKIIYTTNNSADFIKIMQKYGLTELPHIIVNSSLLGVTKPDLPFWEASMIEAEKLCPGIRKDEILLIDDSDVNTESAISFGLGAVLYNGKDADEIIKLAII